MNKKFLFVLIFAVLVIALGVAVASGRFGQMPKSADKVKITASFYPMAEFARQVGGDKVQVTTLVQPGTEPHDYDPAPGDLAGLYRSKLFIYNGAGLEKWVPRIQPDLASNHVKVVNASASIILQSAAPGDQDGLTTDPHVWLDPQLAVQQVTNIEQALAQLDPANANYYHDHAAAFKGQLGTLHEQFQTGLTQCVRRDIVTSHQAFTYLASRYNLGVLSISGLSPDEEPTPQKLAEVARFAAANHVKYIFFETLVSPKLSQTIATEIGAKTLVFNPLEGLTPDESAAGDNYLTVQRQNLNNLRIALDCK